MGYPNYSLQGIAFIMNKTVYLRLAIMYNRRQFSVTKNLLDEEFQE